MKNINKVAKLKVLLQVTDDTQDELLDALLDFAASEILNWLYNGKVPNGMEDVPERYASVQLQAVVIGFSQMGAEGQTVHSENAVNRTFKYSNMIEFIRNNVSAHVEVI